MKQVYKTLSIKAPWAWLIAQGYKDIENRTWYTNIHRDLAIHAGKTFSLKEYLEILAYARARSVDLPSFENLKQYAGYVVALVDVKNCAIGSTSVWAMKDQYHWELANVRPFYTPCAITGKQGIFNAEMDLDLCFQNTSFGVDSRVACGGL